MQIEDLEVALNSRIMDAYLLGMSVMEITRALRKSRIDYVHGFLRDAGCIPAMDRSEYRRSYDIDNRLLAALRNKGYSFGRWCLSWKLDPKLTEVDLKTRQADEELTAAHRAVLRDFPEVYVRLFGGKRSARFGKGRTERIHPSLSIIWDDSQKGYVASVVDYPEVVIVGLDLDDAFEKIKDAIRLFESIRRLDKAVKNFEEI